jgi:mono/diheme cytochrome c family protein
MSRTDITVGLLSMMGTVVLLAFIGIGENSRLAKTTDHQQARFIETGARLYEDLCVVCHGDQGTGVPGKCPPLNTAELFDGTRLQAVGWNGTVEDYVYSRIASGRDVSTRPTEYPGAKAGLKPGAKQPMAMPFWSQDFGGPLRPDQIHMLTQYVMNWATPVAVTAAQAPAADAPAEEWTAYGQGVFKGKGGCAGCHGLPGASAAQLGPDLSGVALTAEQRIDDPGYRGSAKTAEQYLRESIVDPKTYTVADCPTGPCGADVMPATFSTTLTEDEMRGLVGYLMSLR